MAKMLETTTLRSEADGPSTSVVAHIGIGVTILETKGAWTKVRLQLLLPPLPEGWVLTSTIDQAGSPPVPTLDREQLARQCVREAYYWGVNAHYLLAVAQLRSGIALGKEGSSVGPWRLLQAEWDAMRATEKAELDTAPADIENWQGQCFVFGLMALRATDSLMVHLEGRRPNAAELYLAQLIGPKAAAAAIATPTQALDAALAGAADGDLPIGGLDRAGLLERFAALLLQQGRPLTGKAAMTRIEKAFDAALDKTRAMAATAEADILGAAAALVSPDGTPEAILLRRAQTPNRPVRGHLVERLQAALIKGGHMPATDAGGHPTNDGIFGSGTQAALQKWQTENNFGATGALTNAQWRQLTELPVPDIYERCAQVTASFEGTNFGGVNPTDEDKTGLTFGYHGYTLAVHRVDGQAASASDQRSVWWWHGIDRSQPDRQEGGRRESHRATDVRRQRDQRRLDRGFSCLRGDACLQGRADCLQQGELLELCGDNAGCPSGFQKD